MTSERKLAQQRLKIRKKGPNPRALLKPSTLYVVGTCLAVIHLSGVILWNPFPAFESWIFLALGIAPGAMLRTFKIVRVQARFWSFTQKVTNWDIFTEIAQCEICEKREASGSAKKSD